MPLPHETVSLLSMAWLFSSNRPADQNITPGFHPIDIPEPAYSSAPDDTRSLGVVGTREEMIAAIRLQAGLRGIRARRTATGMREALVHAAAATAIQAFARGTSTRADMPRIQKEALEEKAKRYTAASVIQDQYRRKYASDTATQAASSTDASPPTDAFVIKNLDTGEAVSLELGAEQAEVRLADG